MKRVPLTVILILLLCSMLSAQRRGPKVLAAESWFNFGYTPQQAKVSHTYWIHNLGTDTLRVFKIESG
ncbi:MAG: hypothetical protein KAT58_03090 [candidate division Zixibacteria bacterium]|nr:hypothetical protein [candidate division Zixibacteria bacterium]